MEKEGTEGIIWIIQVKKHHCLKFDVMEAESTVYFNVRKRKSQSSSNYQVLFRMGVSACGAIW